MAMAVTYPALWWFNWVCFASVLFLLLFSLSHSLDHPFNHGLEISGFSLKSEWLSRDWVRNSKAFSWYHTVPSSNHVSYQLISIQEWGSPAFLSDREEILPFRPLCNCSAQCWCVGFMAEKSHWFPFVSPLMHFKDARRYLRALCKETSLTFQVVVSSAGNSAALFGCRPRAVDIQDELFHYYYCLGLGVWTNP